METMTLAQARRTALAAQGFGRPRPHQPVTMRQVQRVIDEVAQFQIDSINVVERAHYLPLFSRLGPYDPALLDRAAGRAPRRLFEYWGHAASLIDVRLHPALRPRMARHRAEPWAQVERVQRRFPELDAVIAEALAHGRPLTASQIEHAEDRSRDHWGWNWSSVKYLLEWRWSSGEISPAFRTRSFERAYASTDRVLPPAVLAEPTPSPDEAHDVLVRRAARALGVATVTCLADYFRLKIAPARAAVARLEDAGELVPVHITGWDRPAWRWHEARRPRRVAARALISPFDSLVFERRRLLDLFGVHYRIEIYTPAAERQYGYYVYLFLRQEEFSARVDLKADRVSGRLLVCAAWREPSARAPRAEIAVDLAAELQELARWLGLEHVEVQDRGDLADELAAALDGPSH